MSKADQSRGKAVEDGLKERDKSKEEGEERCLRERR